MLKKDEILSDIIGTFADFNRAKVFLDFQFYLKGENFLLSYLYSIGGESTPGDLASVLHVSGARVAAILRSIERKKLIERIGDKNDKRRVTVRITQKGKEWVTLAGSEMYGYALNVIDKLGEDDTRELVRILKKMMRIENGEEKKAQPDDENADEEAEKEPKEEAEAENEEPAKQAPQETTTDSSSEQSEKI
ncbi:MAG: MarR family winged helix-turn-helix transcriptional regulator [Acutalibacteraceae bacterium]